jgi:hypothetical protein
MIDAIYRVVDDFLSGYNRLYRILERAGFDSDYDPEEEIQIRRKGPHEITIDGEAASYTGPFGDRQDLSFKEMVRFLINPKG